MKIFVKESIFLLNDWFKLNIPDYNDKAVTDIASLIYLDNVSTIDTNNCKDIIIVYCPLFNQANFSTQREYLEKLDLKNKKLIILSVFADSKLTLDLLTKNPNIYVTGVFFLESVTY